MESLSEDRRVPEEGVLHVGLLMVAGHLLPPPATDCLHRRDGAIPRTRPWSPARHTRRPVRWNDDGLATSSRGLVDGDRIVGRVSRDTRDVVVDRLDQADASGRVIDRRIGQRVGHDRTPLVDAEMELLPAALAEAAVFRSSPFSLAHNRQSRVALNPPRSNAASGPAARCRSRARGPDRLAWQAGCAWRVGSGRSPQRSRS